MMELFNGEIKAKYIASPKVFEGLVQPHEFCLGEKMGEFVLFDGNIVYTITLEANGDNVKISFKENGSKLDKIFPSNSNIKNIDELGVKSLDMFVMLSETSLEDIYNLYVNKNQKMSGKEKIIDVVLKEGHEEFVQNVLSRFTDKHEASGVMNKGCLFDILTAYHDGNTSLTVSEMINCKAHNTLYYDDFYILPSADKSLNLIFENTLRPLQPSYLVHELTMVEKITVVENVGMDIPGISIILECDNGLKYGISMRTTNLIINKNMEVK
ncbi:MAG: hypothetical protein ACRCX8_12835 [Sarcina sp.]